MSGRVAPESMRSIPHGLFHRPAYILGGSFAAIFAYLGRTCFDAPWKDLAFAILASNVFCIFAALLAIRLQWNPQIQARFLNRGWKTWAVYLVTYFGLLLATTPLIRDAERFLVLAFPLWFSSWLGTPVFGAIQDGWLRWSRRVKS